MKDDRASQTAEVMALLRAIDHLSEQPIVDDPYAEAFLNGPRHMVIATLRRVPNRLQDIVLGAVDRLVQGLILFALVRHRFMDEVFRTRERGIEQIVLLGAGYDMRSVRLAEAIGDRPVFEVDHPATSARKQGILETSDVPVGPNVRPVAVDLNREPLDRALADAGFEAERPTFFFWEGVTMYLNEEAVRETLSAVRRLSGPESVVTFDHWHPPEDRPVRRLLRRTVPAFLVSLVYEEAFTYVLPREAIGGFLEGLGYRLDQDIAFSDLDRLYTDRWIPLQDFEGPDVSVAVATVV